MSILCDLGWHRASGMVRWNDGYYFSRCKACGQDLVRTAFEGWHVPRGRRVVWSAAPPAARTTPKLAVEQPLSNGQQKAEGNSRRADVPVMADAAVDAALPGGSSPDRPILFGTPDAASPASLAEAEDGARNGNLPIGEVLRILRESESIADELTGAAHFASAPPEPVSGEVEPSPPERPDVSLGSEAELLELRQVDAAQPDQAPPPLTSTDELLSPASAEPDPQTDEPSAPIQGDELVQAESVAESATPAIDLPSAVAAAAPRRSSDPFDDFMADPDEPRPERLVDPAPLTSPMADRDLAPARADLNAASSDRPKTEEGRAVRHHYQDRPPGSMPSAAPTQVHTPILPMETESSLAKWLNLGLAAVLLLIAAIVVSSLGGRGSEAEGQLAGRAAATGSPEAAQGPSEATAPQKAYVSARLLNCRASPVLRARSMRILSRGDEVMVLAREPGWVSVAYRGRQCWTADRYVSGLPPL